MAVDGGEAVVLADHGDAARKDHVLGAKRDIAIGRRKIDPPPPGSCHVGDHQHAELLRRDAAVVIGIEGAEGEAALGRGRCDREPGDFGRRLSLDLCVQGTDETGPAPGELAVRDFAIIAHDAAVEMIAAGRAAVPEHGVLKVGAVFRDLLRRHGVGLADPDHQQRPRPGHFRGAPAEHAALQRRCVRRRGGEARYGQQECRNRAKLRHHDRPPEAVRGAGASAEGARSCGAVQEMSIIGSAGLCGSTRMRTPLSLPSIHLSAMSPCADV